MKKALVTLSYGDHFERMAALTHPTMRAYASRVGADFIKWSDASGYQVPQYKKMEIADLLEDYDRVLFLDTDIVIREDAPNIFDLVPEDSLGMLEEGHLWERRVGMIGFLALVKIDEELWDGNYYNAGVIVASKCHRNVFVRPPIEHDHFHEQTWLNAKICEQKTKMFPLPYKFNRIADADPIYGEVRLDCWFLHYAGLQFRVSREQILDVIKHDLAAWQKFAPRHRYPHKVGIVVDGGLGDQVIGESVIRFAREVFYASDDLVAVSPAPELLAHLKLPVHPNAEVVPFFPHYLKLHTTSAGRENFAPHQIHGTTLASLNALGLELPIEYKTPRLPVSREALASVVQKVQPGQLERLVLLHPGRGLPANTFPPDVWQSYANMLVDNGYQVAVIGKQINSEKGVVDFDRSRCIDLVDRLSVLELVALISQARVLVSNDSGPVQVAGAFDRWIGLIATLRHPHYVFPFRMGVQFYRAASLEHKALYRDYFWRPSGGEKPRLDVCSEGRLRECLPEPQRVLAFVNSAFAEA